MENFVVVGLTEVKKVSLEKMEWIDKAIPLQPDWETESMGVAVFLENESSMKTGGLNWVYPISQRNSGKPNQTSSEFNLDNP